MKVTIESVIAGPAVERFRRLYHDAFDPLRTLAASRQVLTDEEFVAELSDTRVDKYVLWDGDDPIGLSTLTRHLETVPWISPEYFQARYPEYAARDALFYLGITLIDPARRHPGAHAAMISAVVRTLAEANAICGYDVCAYNQDEVRYADSLERFIKRQAPAEVTTIDHQTYYTVDFSVVSAPVTQGGDD